MSRKILKYKPKEGQSQICRRCGFYELVHRARYVKYGGCDEWVPSDNLEYLEYLNEKKSQNR